MQRNEAYLIMAPAKEKSTEMMTGSLADPDMSSVRTLGEERRVHDVLAEG
jgi:hypothetical protein